MAVITENEIDLSVIETQTTKDKVDDIDKHLVRGEDVVQIVGDNGAVYASYGATTALYGDSSSVNLSGLGMDIKDENDNVIFSVNKANDGSEISETFMFSNIPRVGSSKTYTFSRKLTKQFTSFSKIVIAGSWSKDRVEYYSTNTLSGSQRIWLKDGTTTADGTIVRWNRNDDTLTITIEQYSNASEGEPTINATAVSVSIVGIGVSEASIKFNDIEMDRIVESGTSGVWNYEKWASGKLVQWAVTSYEGKIATSQAGDYSTASLAIDDYPIPFVGNPCVMANSYCPSDSNSRVGIYPSPTPTVGIGHYRLFRGNAQNTSYSYTVCFDVKGRWK